MITHVVSCPRDDPVVRTFSPSSRGNDNNNAFLMTSMNANLCSLEDERTKDGLPDG